MTTHAPPGPAIGIAGFGRIGRVHARVLTRLGARVVATLSSSKETAAASAAWAAEHLNSNVVATTRLDALLARPLDGLVICTPPALHLDHLLLAFDAGLPVFCEKPLLWRAGDTVDSVAADLERLAAHPQRDLLVNTSNTVFLDVVADRLEPADADATEPFFFRFHTRGPYQGIGIAEDLLPHGLSLLLHRYGLEAIKGVAASVRDTAVEYRFGYGRRQVTFDFHEHADAEKALAFAVGDRRFDRVQEGQGDTYRVSLRDAITRERVAAPDPFVVYAQRFLERCGSGASAGTDGLEVSFDDPFDVAAANATLMAQLLTAAHGG